jgi:hypothetical protein
MPRNAICQYVFNDRKQFAVPYPRRSPALELQLGYDPFAFVLQQLVRLVRPIGQIEDHKVKPHPILKPEPGVIKSGT